MKKTLLAFCATCVIGLAAVVAHPADAQLRVRGNQTFVKGINLPWLTFSHTFGVEPIYGGAPTYDPNAIDADFAALQSDNVNVVRVFICEGLDGITFDNNGYASGLQQVFLNNLDDLFSKADNHGLALELMIFDGSIQSSSDITYNLYGATVNSGGNIPDSGSPADTYVMNWFSDSGAQSAMVNNVIAALAQRYQYDPALFSFDLINESNYGVQNGAYSNDQLRSFIWSAANAIHTVNSGIQVTCSTDNLSLLQDENRSGSYEYLGLDYYELHVYDTNINLPTVGQGDFNPDLPVELGETGPTFYGGETDQYNDGLQASEMDAAINQTSQRGWAGVMPWSYLDDGNGMRIQGRPSESAIANDYANL